MTKWTYNSCTGSRCTIRYLRQSAQLPKHPATYMFPTVVSGCSNNHLRAGTSFPLSVWRQSGSGRLVSRRASAQFRFDSPFSSKNVVVCGHCLVTFYLTINETLKWLSSLPILMQESFWWWQCSDRCIISLFLHFYTPFHPFSPSLMNLMVYVDVKYHVYFV